ncbi:major allergen Pru ar 1-like [Punica granatum]|uniref:Bet v I/Major latex protein domain-containing protein n=2 Tax=Punica granatum TaxID=22663 RepID=A0A218XST9_PUNGR|nr:major allergen Pru ar 1-like [Punica granatum]OWM88097.1 hypothetical protein CDL15_Pgr016670 [Punica granatum]PKI46048.1 hypothetical protein CRG98_033577 [Punica granatum]
MQNVTSFSQDFTCPVAPARMFKALCLDSHKLIPKLVPQGIKSNEIIQGDGGPGTIKKTTFAEGSQLKSMKHRIDAIDTENMMCKYTLIECDVLQDRLEAVLYEVKFEDAGNGESICRMSSEYHTKPGVELNEEDIKRGKDRALGLFNIVEEYLMANPTVYA